MLVLVWSKLLKCHKGKYGTDNMGSRNLMANSVWPSPTNINVSRESDIETLQSQIIVAYNVSVCR